MTPVSETAATAVSKAKTVVPETNAPERLVSLDAYRGFIMLAMASAGFGLAAVAKKFPDSEPWQAVGYQAEHVPWAGCSFWDLIQPSFMFMVGVSMAYSYAGRAARGQAFRQMAFHALRRSLVLILLGVFLTSNWNKQTNFIFTNVLAQIGLGYFPLFLLWRRPAIVQLLAAAVVLVAYWGLFAAYPAPGPDFDFPAVGVPADWPDHPPGFGAHWDKNSNVAATADVWLLNQFPREKPFAFSEGGYQTLNFVPSLATMIFGLLAGELLRGPRRPRSKLAILIGAGLAALAIGWALGEYDVCPVVKRIWTPSWAVYSTGWTLLILAGFYAVIDLVGWRRWAFPLVIVGMNSIAIYCMSQLLKPWLWDTLKRHLAPPWVSASVADFFGSEAYAQFWANYEPAVKATCILLVLWVICYWLYRQRIFIRI